MKVEKISPRFGSRFAQAVAFSLVLGIADSHAATQTWTGATSSTWETTSNWGATTPTSSDIALWDTASTSNLSITLGSSESVAGLKVGSPSGAVTLSGNTLTVGTSGIDMSSATQNLTISSGLTLGAGNQTWNVATGKTLTLNTGTFTRSAGATLLIDKSTNTGTIAANMTNLNATSVTANNGIVGPWAVIKNNSTAASNNTANGYTFGTITSGNLVAYTAATPETTTASAWGGIPSGGTGTVNYDISIAGTPGLTGLNRNVNTIRYTGSGMMQNGNTNTTLLNVNAILNAGTGTFILGGAGTAYSIAPSSTTLNELVLAAANANITIGPVANIVNNTNPGAVTVTGPNTVTLSGSNTFTGGLTVTSGTLSVSTNLALGGAGGTAGAVTLNGGTLSNSTGITNTHAITIGAAGGTINVPTTGQYFFNTANTLLGGGALTLTGSGGTLIANTGNLRVAQTNTYSGNVILQSGGIFEYGVAGAVGAGATFTINNQGELAVQNATALPNNITVNGSTNSVLSFENGTTGNFSGNIANNGALTVGLRDWYAYGTARSGTISGIVSGTGSLAINGGSTSGGVVVLSASNTYSGGTTLGSAGAILANNNTALGTGTVTVNAVTNTQLQLGSGVNVGNALIINGGGIATQGVLWVPTGSATYSGAITINGVQGAGGHFATNGGTLTLSGPITSSVPVTVRTGTVLLSNTNSSYSTLTIQAGTVQLGANNAIPAAVTSDLGISAAATLDLAGFNQTLAGITKNTNSATVTNSLASSTSTLTTTGNSTFAGVIQNGAGTTALTVNGGSLNLTGANTYTGATSVTNGTLTIGNGTTGSLNASSAVSVGATGTLAVNLASASTFGNAVANNGTVNLTSSGTTTYSGAFSGSGAINQNGGVAILSGSNNSTGAVNVNTGTATFAGAGSIGALTVADNATLGLKVTSTSTTIVAPSSATFGNSGASNFAADFNFLSNPTAAMMAVSGTLTLNGTVNVSLANMSGLSTTNNTLQLISYGSQTGSGTFNLTTTSAGHTTFSLNDTATALFLNVNAATNTWTGANSNTWDINATQNWSISPDHVYLDGDNVVFNDTAQNNNFNVSIGSTVSPSTVTFANSSAHTYTVSGAGIAGNGPLVLSGSNSTVILTNANTYTGSTTIGVGDTLQLGDGTTDGTITNSVSITNNGTLIYNRSTGSSFTYNNVISGIGALVKSGTGTQILGGTNTYSGGTTINAGTLQLTTVGPDGASVNNGTYNLNGGAFQINQSVANFGYNATINLTAAGSSFSNVGAGQINYTGTMNGNGNALTIAGNSARLYMNGTVNNVSQFNVNSGAMGLDTGTGNQGGGAPVAVANGAALWVWGVNALTNNLTFNGGSGVNGGGALYYEGGTTNPAAWTGAITLASGTTGVGGGFTADTVTLAGSITGSGALNKLTGDTYVLSGSNSYSGGTTLSAGNLVINHNNALGTGAFTINGGTIDSTLGGITLVNIAQNWNADFTFAGTQSLNLGTGAVTMNANRTVTVTANTLTVGGSIGGAFNFTKAGAGTLALSGSNNYSGVTNVNAGILNAQNSYAFGASGTVTETARSAGIQLQGNISIPSAVSFITSNDGTGTVPYTIDNVSDNNTINGNITLTSGGGNTIVQSDSGALTLSGTIAPANTIGARTLFLQGASTAANTISGILKSGTGAADVLSVTKLGTGAWTISGTGTYTGATTVSAGTLNLSGALANSAISVASGAAFNESSSGVISGTTGLTTAGLTTLSGSNSYTGATAISGGTLKVANAFGLGATSSINPSGTTGILQFATDGSEPAYTSNFGTGTIFTIVSDRDTAGAGINHTLGAVTWGGGTVNFTSGTNVTSGTGSITITSLGLTAGSAQTTFLNPTSATVSIGSVSIPSNNQNKTVGLDGTTAGNIVTGSITDGVATGANHMNLTKSNTSTWTLTGNSTYTGATTISGGTLQLGDGTNGHDGTIANTSGVSVASGATLAFNRSGTVTSNYAITGAGALTMTGAGTQVLTADSSSFSGTTTVNGGKLLVAGSLAGSTSTVNSDGTLGGSGSVGAVTVNGGGTLAAGLDSAGTTAGTLTANGNVSFAGGTAHLSIRLGETTATDGDKLATSSGSAVTVSLNGADLQLTLGSNYSHNDSQFFVIVANLNASSTVSGLFAQGNNQITASYGIGQTETFNIIYNYVADGDSIANDIALQAVPEPGTWAMLFGGVAILGLYQKLRRRSA